MVRAPTFALSTTTSIVLLFLGGFFAYSNVVWSAEWTYIVDVAAPDGVTWTLWIPHPGLSMPWTTSGSVAVVGTMESPYGKRINITGTGAGQVRFSNSTTVIGFDPLSAIPPGLSLSGGEGGIPPEFYRVWRGSSDPSANLTLSGGLRFTATSPPQVWTCDGSGFIGHPEEGWRDLPSRFGDCVLTFASLPRLFPLALLGFGSVLAGVAVGARRRLPAGP